MHENKKNIGLSGTHVPRTPLDPSLKNTLPWFIYVPSGGSRIPTLAPTLQGAPTSDFAQFSEKLHEIERIWTGGSKIVLCRSATGTTQAVKRSADHTLRILGIHCPQTMKHASDEIHPSSEIQGVDLTSIPKHHFLIKKLSLQHLYNLQSL